MVEEKICPFLKDACIKESCVFWTGRNGTYGRCMFVYMAEQMHIGAFRRGKL